MKILVFTEGTITVHKEAAGHTREEIVQQSLNRDTNGINIEDYKNYILLGNPVAKLQSWENQGAEIVYMTSRTEPEEIEEVRQTLEKYNLPDRQNLFYRQNGESYSQAAERIMPDILIEDDCESIGGEAEMTYTNIKPELKPKIKHIVIKEFEGIDHLPDKVEDL